MTSPGKLIEKFGGADSEHPKFTTAEWACAAASGDTRKGYWEWASERIREESEPVELSRAELRLVGLLDGLEQFTAADASEAMGIARNGVFKYLRRLLRRGVVQVVGEVPNLDGPGKMRLYRMNPEAIGQNESLREISSIVPHQRISRAYAGISAHNPFGL